MWGISGDAGGLVRHQKPGDEVDQDLRARQKKAGHENDSNNSGIEIEATGDSRAHARDHPVVIRAVELHVALSFLDTVEVVATPTLRYQCAINARFAGTTRVVLRAQNVASLRMLPF